MKRALLLCALVVAVAGCLAATAAAATGPSPHVACANCGGGGGASTCSSVYGQDHGDDSFFGDSYTVYLGVNWCFNGGTVTSASVQQYGCRASGGYACGSQNGPFLVGGGVGQSFVHFTFNANISLETNPGTSYNKTVDCYVYANGASHC